MTWNRLEAWATIIKIKEEAVRIVLIQDGYGKLFVCFKEVFKNARE